MDFEIKQRTLKQMLYISITSIIMMFAGLTSAYIVSRKREDWVSFDLPQALYISTVLILLSSLSFLMARRYIKKNNRELTTLFLVVTILLGSGFVFFQVKGFEQLREMGLFFTGDQSVVSSSLLVVISFVHLLHVLAGIIVLLIILMRNLAKKYSDSDYLGLELGGIFWHFVDILWIFLFLFFYFIT
ncbi:MAG: cytochrome c oxidase subunit 3 [Flavobacteriaceae bacterium]|nr:cytochrome c oxidase subunit 3 [Flavobacteriaceae bacterium]MCB0474853.1 cytochrome c oxidase subunit 3 [Flavobacteriaceae bacterium]